MIDDKLKDVESNLDKYSNPEKSTHIKTFAQINEKHYDYHAYFLPKQEAPPKPSADPVL